jgi:hypothetical protein
LSRRPSGRDRTPDPRQGHRHGPGVELEYLDRFAPAVVHDVQRMHVALPGLQVEAVRPELVLVQLLGVERAGTRRIGRRIEPLGPVRRREEHRGGLVGHVDEVDAAALLVAGHDDPLVAGHDSQIFRTDQVADESDVAHRLAPVRFLAGEHPAPRHHQRESQGHELSCFHDVPPGRFPRALDRAPRGRDAVGEPTSE